MCSAPRRRSKPRSGCSPRRRISARLPRARCGPITTSPATSPSRRPIRRSRRCPTSRRSTRKRKRCGRMLPSQNNIRVAELEVQKQRGAYFPVVTFDAGYINQKAAFPTSHYGYGAFRFTVPIWQSGQVESRVAIAKEREQQARLLLEDAKIAAREDVHRAVTDLNAADTTLQLAKEQLAAAEAEYAQVFELYRAQEATSLDLASSEVSLADARRAVAAETLNHNLAQLRVWYAAGAIKDAVGVGATQR